MDPPQRLRLIKLRRTRNVLCVVGEGFSCLHGAIRRNLDLNVADLGHESANDRQSLLDRRANFFIHIVMRNICAELLP